MAEDVVLDVETFLESLADWFQGLDLFGIYESIFFNN